jgi:hypothetical protein
MGWATFWICALWVGSASAGEADDTDMVGTAQRPTPEKAKKPKKPPAVPARAKTPASPKPAPRPGAERPATSRPPRVVTGRPTEPRVRATQPTAVRTTAREAVPTHSVPRTTRPASASTTPLHRSADHRYARPDPFLVHTHPLHPAPAHRWYRPHWTHWWVHPYWRWTHATVVVVTLPFAPAPWETVWVPPVRAGWVWVTGHWAGPVWVPGHWAPSAPAPVLYGASWVYVPGFWMGHTYLEGYWRLSSRPGWVWAEGYYLDDGSYVRGLWVPQGAPPRTGYVWEGGYWDGQYWVEGFWRPKHRTGYRWVSAWLEEDGVFHQGFWEPTEDRPGHVWIPGWFDGTAWVEGYWVEQAEYDRADPETWQPEPGWDAHQDEAPPPSTDSDEPPPAIPIR